MPVYWLATLVFLLIVHPLVARVTRLGAAMAGTAVGGFLGWVDPALTAFLAAPLVAGALANRRAAVARADGMSAVSVMLDRVSAGTTQLISAARSVRVRHEHLATVDRFHDVFNAQTRRVSTAVTLVEVAFSPVTILAVTLSAGMVLVTPRADMLAFLLLGPVAGDCVARLTQHQSPGARPPFTTDTPVNIHTTLSRLRLVVALGGEMRQAAIAAIITALVHGASLAVAITMVRSLFDQSSWPQPLLFSLLALFLAHTLALWWSISSAQLAGISVLRQLSYRIIDRILTAPEGSLTQGKDQLLRLVTRGVVTISGLPVHALRPFVSAGLTPMTAMLMMPLIKWWLAVPALLMLPLVVLVILLLLREPWRDLQSALTATNRVLTFLER